MITYLFLIIGFVLLIKGADFFVDGSSGIAKLLKVPSIIIGLTIVAFGTSLPEASVSITAALQGKNELAVSNVLGSNMFNLLVVLGFSAIVMPMKVKISVLKKEFPFSVVITLILLFAMTGARFGDVIQGENSYTLGRVSGILFLILFVLFVFSAVKDALKSRKEAQELGEEEEYKSLPLTRCLIYIVGGIAAIALGGDLVVDSASQIAVDFGLSQTFIGLTIVAMGTSLPELVTSMVAARKGENDLALGNVVGSNIFNILLVLGASAAICPIMVDLFAVYDTIILIVASLAVYLCAVSKKGISRWEGILFLLVYAGFFAYIFTR